MFWRESLGNCWCGSLAAKIQTNNIWIILLIIEKGGRTYDLKVQIFSFKPYIPKKSLLKEGPKEVVELLWFAQRDWEGDYRSRICSKKN